MARDASTYRGARRNQCIRVEHGVWGPFWYYSGHNKDAHRYAPATKQRRKQAKTVAGLKLATSLARWRNMVAKPERTRAAPRGQ